MTTVLATSDVVKILVWLLRVLHAGRCSLRDFIYYILVPVEEERFASEHDF